MPDVPPTLRFDPDADTAPADDQLLVDLDQLVASRLLLQAASGAGKSWAIRYMLEETFGHIPALVLDPEGEFFTLRERYPFVWCGGEGADVPAQPESAGRLARRLVDVAASAVLDLYHLDVTDRKAFVGRFCRALVNLPRDAWRPYLVVLDEAQTFAPQRGGAESLDPVTNLAFKGRKRGFGLVLATPRIGAIDKDAAAPLQNKLVGRTTLDVDVKRAAEDLGFGRGRRDELRGLPDGTFFATGPAISKRGVVKVRTGDVHTTHPEPGKVSDAEPPPAPEEVRDLLGQMQDMAAEEAEEAEEIDRLREEVARLRSRLREAETPTVDGQAKELEEARARIRELEERHEEASARAVYEAVCDERERWEAYAARLEGKLEVVAGIVWSVRDALERDADALPLEIDTTAGADRPPFPEDLGDIPEPEHGTPPVEDRYGPPEAWAGDGSPDRGAGPHGASFRPGPPQAVPRLDPADGDGEELQPAELARGERRILDVLAMFAALGVDHVPRGTLARQADLTPSGGTWSTYMAHLRGEELVTSEEGGRFYTIRLPRGAALADTPPRPPSPEEWFQRWREILRGSQPAMVQALLEARPDGLTREELGQAVDLTPSGGTFSSYLAELRHFDLAVEDSDRVRPSARLVAAEEGGSMVEVLHGTRAA